MTIIDLNKKKTIRMSACAKAEDLHRKMLDLAGNPEVLADFIKDNDFGNELYKIILESETYLQNQEDNHDP